MRTNLINKSHGFCLSVCLELEAKQLDRLNPKIFTGFTGPIHRGRGRIQFLEVFLKDVIYLGFSPSPPPTPAPPTLPSSCYSFSCYFYSYSSFLMLLLLLLPLLLLFLTLLLFLLLFHLLFTAPPVPSTPPPALHFPSPPSPPAPVPYYPTY